MTFMQQFPECHFDCEGVFVGNCWALGASDDIGLRWRVRTTNRSGRTFDNSGLSFVRVRRGKIVFFKHDCFSTESMAEAWGEPDLPAEC